MILIHIRLLELLVRLACVLRHWIKDALLLGNLEVVSDAGHSVTNHEDILGFLLGE